MTNSLSLIIIFFGILYIYNYYNKDIYIQVNIMQPIVRKSQRDLPLLDPKCKVLKELEANAWQYVHCDYEALEIIGQGSYG